MPVMIAQDNLAVVILLCGEIWNSIEGLYRAILKENYTSLYCNLWWICVTAVLQYDPDVFTVNTFTASYLNTQGLNNSYLKSPALTLVDLTFQSCALRSFSLNQLRNLSL